MGSNLHILVVDDRPDSVLLLTEFLLSHGHRVETCDNGPDALEAIIRHHRTADVYDLLISDVTMPDMDGLTLVKELRRRHMLLPVALYTAFGSMHPNLAQQAQQQGCLMVLEKPIELRRVENLLETVMARRTGSQRQEKDQPFFGTGTSRVTRSSTTSAHRRETSQPAELDSSSSGGYALEPKRVIPLPPSQPLVPDTTPSPIPPPPAHRAPQPIRTPVPFPIEKQEPQTRSMPSFRTPLPPDKQGTMGRRTNPNFRTPLPFLQDPPAGHTAPTIPPTVASAPQVRSSPRSDQPIQNNSEESKVPPQPPHSTAFVRRGVNPLNQDPTSGRVRRPSGLFLQSKPTEPSASSPPINPVGTSRIRRTVTGSYLPTPIGAGKGQSQNPSPAADAATRAVACAHCGQVFMVASRAVSFTAMCVHCGQVNRIEPL